MSQKHHGHHSKRRAYGITVRLKAERGLTPRHVLRHSIRLPAVVGETFEYVHEALHTEYETVSAGAFSQPYAGDDAVALRSLSLDTMAMAWSPSWLTNPETSPKELRRTLERLADSRAAFHLLGIVHPRGQRITNRPEFKGLVTLRSMTPRLRRGENDTRYYSLDFREYRKLHTGRRRHGDDGGSGKGGKLPTKHVLDKDDTFEHLAHHYYGDASQWRQIAEANGAKKWGSEDPIVDMKRFHAGDSVRIPKPAPGFEASWSSEADGPDWIVERA